MSENKVVPISNARAVEIGELDTSTIVLLETLLEQARRGEITGIAFAALGPNGNQSTGWDGAVTIERTGFAIASLSHRFFTACNNKPD